MTCWLLVFFLRNRRQRLGLLRNDLPPDDVPERATRANAVRWENMSKIDVAATPLVVFFCLAVVAPHTFE